MRFSILLLLPVFGWAQTCDTFPGHARRAFVVGNGAYLHLPAAPQAEEDERRIAQALADAGFDVTPALNRAKNDFFFGDQANFIAKVQPGDVVFFYYAGHIVQGTEDDDDDFILPPDFDPSQGANSGLSLRRFLDDLKARKPGLTIVLIEGPHGVSAGIPGSRTGLTLPDLSDNGQILFAEAVGPGSPAGSAQSQEASRLTIAVEDLLKQPGLDLSSLFERRAVPAVLAQSGRTQIPFVQNLSGAAGNFCFHEAPKVETRIETPVAPQPEVIVQTEVKTIPVPTNSRDHEDYIRIQHGVYKMGCVPADMKCKDEEKPQHEVTITKDFYLGRNEVQVDSFRRFLSETQKKPKMPPEPAQDYDHWKRDNLPMVMVYWQDAVDYCKWAGGRLPTEAEWEYAVRAGASDEVYPLNRIDSREKANFEHTQGNDIYEGVAPIRKFEPNKFGLYDMSGNVWEWVSDAFDKKYYSESSAVDPAGPAGSATAKEHVVRGGSFEDDWQTYSRLSYRKALGGRDFKTGFRCVLDDTPENRKNLGIKP